MNTHRILLSILVLLPWLESKAAFTEGALPLGVLFVSPDGQYSVQLEEIDRAPHFLIKTMATGQVDNSIVMPTRLLYLHWAANSKSFVTVEHIAKGSRGRVIYLEADKWRNVTVVPPLEAKMYYTVINLQLEIDRVCYKFTVTTLTDNWKPIDNWACDLDVSLEAGKIFNVRWTPITEAASAASWTAEPLYLPPMDYKGPRER